MELFIYIGALLILIGFWGIRHSNYSKDPPKIALVTRPRIAALSSAGKPYTSPQTLQTPQRKRNHEASTPNPKSSADLQNRVLFSGSFNGF